MNVGTILPIAIISMLCAVLIMSFNSILTCLIWYRIQNIFPHLRLIIFPVIWTSVEFIRSYGILGFPWISLANSQIDYLYLIQNAEITGIYGVTFWVVMINILIYQIFFENKDRLLTIYAAIIFIFPWFFGYFLYSKTNSPENNISLSVTLIQPNINLINKRDFKVTEEEKSFGIEPEITIKLAKKKVKFFEVPITYNGRDYNQGKKIKAKDAFIALYCIIKYSLFR